MTRSLKLLSLACLLIAMAGGTGCGGGLTQKDMMRNAIRRTPDDDDDETGPARQLTRPSESDRGRLQVAAEGSGDDASSALPADGLVGNAAQGVATTRLPGAPRPNATAVVPDAKQDRTQSDGAAPPFQPLEPAADPGEPTTPRTSRQQAIAKMVRIGAALEAYLSEQRHYPPRAIYGTRKEPLLSWRVALLPYLGHADLHARFKLDEPWNSKHNQPLITQIPAVFATPGIELGKTNFLLPVGPGTAFSSHRGMTVNQIEDGVENTVLLLEVDHDRAVAWTAPQDHAMNLHEPRLGLGGLRQGGFLVIWGGGTANWIPHATPTNRLQAAFTPDAGDGILASQIGNDPLADLEPVNGEPTGADVAGNKSLATQNLRDSSSGSRQMASEVNGGSGVPRPPAGRRGGQGLAPASHGLTATTGRHPSMTPRHAVPSGAALSDAKAILSDLYQQQYRQATSTSQKQALAQEMLDRLHDIDGDIPGQYALIDTVRQIAIQAGAVDTALRAVDELSNRFEVDSHDEKLAALVGLARSAGGEHSQLVVEACQEAIRSAWEAEAYDAADQLCGIALAAAKKTRDASHTHTLQRLRQDVQAAQRAHVLAERSIKTLENDPDDRHAAALLGSYLCLIREDWANGLPVLAGGDDPLLSPLARRELDQPSRVEDQVALADGWWRAGEKVSQGGRRAMLARAVHWYELATPQLPPGLARVRIDRRLQHYSQARTPHVIDN